MRKQLLQRFVSLAIVLILGSCAAPAPQICSENDLNLWRLSAIQAIRPQVRYPPEALRRKLEGSVRVDVSVDATGKLVRATLAQSSGFAILDAEALDAVRTTTLPAPRCGTQTSHTLPIGFAIDSIGPTDSARDWVDRIRAKIRTNLLLPKGTPPGVEVSFSVVQLPTGEILRVQMLSSSGFTPYDEATERAILKSSPLPKAPTADFFRREVILRFQP